MHAHRIMGSLWGKSVASRSCFSVKKCSVFGNRMPYFAVILSAAEETNVDPLKL